MLLLLTNEMYVAHVVFLLSRNQNIYLKKNANPDVQILKAKNTLSHFNVWRGIQWGPFAMFSS